VSYLSLLSSIDRLYESVVSDPAAWGDQAFSDWANDTLIDAGSLPKEAVREVRRCLRAARKLQVFWSSATDTAVTAGDDWRTRVDVALGPRAWRPALDLARIGLERAPSPELFDQVKQRFPVVNLDRWMEGVDYATWAGGG